MENKLREYAVLQSEVSAVRISRPMSEVEAMLSGCQVDDIEVRIALCRMACIATLLEEGYFVGNRDVLKLFYNGPGMYESERYTGADLDTALIAAVRAVKKGAK